MSSPKSSASRRRSTASRNRLQRERRAARANITRNPAAYAAATAGEMYVPKGRRTRRRGSR